MNCEAKAKYSSSTTVYNHKYCHFKIGCYACDHFNSSSRLIPDRLDFTPRKTLFLLSVNKVKLIALTHVCLDECVIKWEMNAWKQYKQWNEIEISEIALLVERYIAPHYVTEMLPIAFEKLKITPSFVAFLLFSILPYFLSLSFLFFPFFPALYLLFLFSFDRYKCSFFILGKRNCPAMYVWRQLSYWKTCGRKVQDWREQGADFCAGKQHRR